MLAGFLSAISGHRIQPFSCFDMRTISGAIAKGLEKMADEAWRIERIEEFEFHCLA